MPKIFILNAATEQMSGDSLTPIQRQLAAKAGWRNAWFARAGDILVMPIPASEEFLAYVGRTMGFDASSVSVVSPTDDAGDEFSLTDARLLSEGLVRDLRRLVQAGESWVIDPVYYTEGVVELASLLGVAAPPGELFASQRGCDLLNRKSHFRQLAVGAGVPIASGSVAHDAATLARAIEKQLSHTGTIIVKKDNGSGGMGNITLTRDEAKPLAGTRETRRVPVDIEAMAADLWTELTEAWSPTVIVEAYYAASHKFYFEYLIHDDGSSAFLASGTIRTRPDTDLRARELVWVGLELPAELPPGALDEVSAHCDALVALVARIGYRGPINIDAIITEGGKVVFNEMNGRWGGGSVLHALGERLLGKGYSATHVVASLRNVAAPSLSEVVSIFEECGLHFDPATKEGALVLATDEHLTRAIECAVVGSSPARVRAIEARILDAIEGRARNAAA